MLQLRARAFALVSLTTLIPLTLHLAAGPAAAQGIYSDRIAAGFNQPLFAASAPGDPTRLWVVERTGNIRILNTITGAIEGTFLDVAATPNAGLITGGGEQGLLGLAFHPDYVNNGRFYTYHITNNGNGGDPNGFSRVTEFTRSAGNPYVADPNSARRILQFQQPFTNHNGGWMGFSPRDGNLYIASGDGGDANDPLNNAQNRASLLGKMLRINVNGDDFADPNINYAIPLTNPFRGNGFGFREEIWSYGLRNPWRSSFDRVTHDLWIGDVGQGAWEEVDFQAAASVGGENYGWRALEGTHDNGAVPDPPPSPRVDPVHEYSHAVGASITGGYMFHGPDLLDPVNGDTLDYAYFFADYISARIWTLRPVMGGYDLDERTAALQNSIDGFTINNIASFAEDGFGNLYVIDYGGEVFLIRGTAVPEPSFLLAGAAVLGGWLWRRRQTARQADASA